MSRGTLRDGAGSPVGLAVLGFGAFAAVVPFQRPVLFRVGSSGAQIADLVLPVVWVLAAIAALGRRLRPRVDGLLIAPIVFVVAQLVSMVVAHQLAPTSVVKLAAFSELLLLPWLATHLIADEVSLRRVLVAMLIGYGGAVGVGLVGFVAYYLDREGVGKALMCGWGGIRSGVIPRLCAPFNNPNLFLNYLTTITPFVFVVFAQRLAADSLRDRALPWALLVAACFVSMFTLSAGVGGFAIAGALSLAAWRRSRDLRPNLFERGILTLAGMLAVFFLLSMVVTIQPAGQGDVRLGSHDVALFDGMRPSIWKGLRVGEHPLTGVGYAQPPALTTDPRSFTPPDKLKLVTYPVAPHAMDAHNVVLSVLGQSGALGLGAFALMLAVVGRGLLWRRSPALDRDGTLLTRLVAAGVIGALVYHGLFGSFEEARHVWLALAIGAAGLRMRGGMAAVDRERSLEGGPK